MMVKNYRIALCFLTLLLGAAHGVWAQTLIRVYVQAGSGEFAANGAEDSAGDLSRSLAGKSKTLRVVENPSDADIVLRIDSRNVRKELSSVNTYTSKSDDGKKTTSTTSPTMQTINVLHATLLAGSSEIPMKAESSLSWRLASGNMASNVEKWARQNYAKLLERRASQPRSATPAEQAVTEPPTDAAHNSSAQTSSDDASITVGMTEAEVLKAMGVPQKKVNFGNKSMWNYRGMQVVFEDHKVTDVKF
ncbi:hypothetical protein [Terracidiphilus gabretensis]|jgi:hypothetical protein|uniref:hypothetical protein n=1 Tax=Terracidiphilus gabretensis TaxID=1577687 RepID=UPI00071B3B58|nr:hypothetical protein [Terracidiphilus gabretensis]